MKEVDKITEEEREERRKFFKEHDIPCHCDGRICTNCYRYYTAGKMVLIEIKDGEKSLVSIPAYMSKAFSTEDDIPYTFIPRRMGEKLTSMDIVGDIKKALNP